jgi:DNA-binding NarL/FixJ family response regulator
MNIPAQIMVVENNPRARNALAAFLSLQVGFSVTAQASNGSEAIHKIKARPPDIVLMDMRMPGMDGLEATRIIKERWPKVKVIALTMYQNYQSEALSAGADAFLVKGCSGEDLITIVSSLIDANTSDNLPS